MRRFFGTLVVFIATLLVLSPSSVYAVEAKGTPSPSPTTEVNSFDMFWPVVAGKVNGERFYSLKIFKENAREKLIYSKYKRVDYNRLLSEKRTVEAEKLYLIVKNYSGGKVALERAQEKRETAISLMKEVEASGKSVVDLKNALRSSFEKQKALISFIQNKSPDDQKETLQSNISSIDTLLGQLQ